MENFFGIFPGLLTPEWVMTAVFNLVLLIIVYVRSRSSGSKDPIGRGTVESSAAGTQITIVNNLRGIRVARRNRIRRRRLERTRITISDGANTEQGDGG